VHIVEVQYDNEDEEMHVNATIDAYLEQSDKGSESCTSEGQLEGQDDIAYPSSSLLALIIVRRGGVFSPFEPVV
jgi:hypothetical protein